MQLIRATKGDEEQCRLVYEVFNENIEWFEKTTEEISYADHKKWWGTVFDRETVYIILALRSPIGYVRVHNKSHLVSIALYKRFQDMHYGQIALSLLKKDYPNNSLMARIKEHNVRSLAIFRKNKIPIIHV